ncbi:unnamed protein product, partial [Notodromas monacha]
MYPGGMTLITMYCSDDNQGHDQLSTLGSMTNQDKPVGDQANLRQVQFEMETSGDRKNLKQKVLLTNVLGTLSVFYFGILVVGEYFAVDAKPSNIKWAPKSAMDVISLLPSLATGSGVMTVYTELKRLRVGDHFELIGKEEKTVRIVFSIVWLLTCLLSAFIPAVIIVIHRIGALCVLLMFFFPGVCLIKLVQNEHPRPFRNRSKLLFATGDPRPEMGLANGFESSMNGFQRNRESMEDESNLM